MFSFVKYYRYLGILLFQPSWKADRIPEVNFSWGELFDLIVLAS